MKNLFIPNRPLTKHATRALILTEAGLLGCLWVFSPFTLLPKPGEVFRAIGDLWAQGLPGELLISLWLNLEAIALATGISLVLAYSTRLPFMRPAVALIGKLRFLSMAGLSFLFTILAANGHQLKLYLLVFSVSVFFVTGMADVIASIPKEQYDLARTLRMGEWRIVWEVVVLGQAHSAWDVLRQNAAMGWLMLTFVEGLSRSGGGIGAMLLDSQKHFKLSYIFGIQLILLLTGILQDYGIGFLKTMFCPYAQLVVEKQ